MVSDEALKKLQEQIAAWPMTQRFVVQQLIRDYLRDREDLRAYEDTGLTPERCAEFARADAMVECNGEMVTLAEASRRIGISESAVWMRIKREIQVDMEPYKWEKPVIRDDGAIFHSVKEAAKSVGVHDTKVSAVCKGNRKTTGGHSFRFLTREEAEKALEAMKDE